MSFPFYYNYNADNDEYYNIIETGEAEDYENYCLLCHLPMGPNNNRQLCGKITCASTTKKYLSYLKQKTINQYCNENEDEYDESEEDCNRNNNTIPYYSIDEFQFEEEEEEEEEDDDEEIERGNELDKTLPYYSSDEDTEMGIDEDEEERDNEYNGKNLIFGINNEYHFGYFNSDTTSSSIKEIIV